MAGSGSAHGCLRSPGRTLLPVNALRRSISEPSSERQWTCTCVFAVDCVLHPLICVHTYIRRAENHSGLTHAPNWILKNTFKVCFRSYQSSYTYFLAYFSAIHAIYSIDYGFDHSALHILLLFTVCYPENISCYTVLTFASFHPTHSFFLATPRHVPRSPASSPTTTSTWRGEETPASLQTRRGMFLPHMESLQHSNIVYIATDHPQQL